MNREEWDQRWDSPDWVSGPDPHGLLVQEVESLPPGSALDLACGNGRDSVWLAGRGWTVTAVDFSEVALAKARDLAAERGVEVRWLKADLLTYEPPRTAFDLIVVMYFHPAPEHRRRLLAVASAALRRGGTLVMVGYDRSHRGLRWSDPSDLTRLLSPDEVAAELEGLRVVKAVRVNTVETLPDGLRPAVEVVIRAERP